VKGVFTGTRGDLWSPDSKVQRCGARTRSGGCCKRPAEVNPLTGKRTRCRFHGGLAGCRTAEGKARISAANHEARQVHEGRERATQGRGAGEA